MKDCGSVVSLLNPIRQPKEWAIKCHGGDKFFCFAKFINSSKSNWYSAALEICWILGWEGKGRSESPQPLQSSVATLNPLFLKNNKSIVEDDIDYFPVSKIVNNPKTIDKIIS